MAKVDNTEVPSFYMNPSAFSQVKGDVKKEKGRAVRRSGETGFSRIFNEFRAKPAMNWDLSVIYLYLKKPQIF